MEGTKKKKKKTVPLNFSCKICGEKCNDHQHFGASMCCYSCKAFFRRTIKGNVTYPPCQMGGNCQINSKNRSSCQTCRYLKCVSIGMDSKWVMKDRDIKEKKEVAKMKQLLGDNASTSSLQTEYQIKTRLERTRKPKSFQKGSNSVNFATILPQNSLDFFLTIEEDNWISKLSSIFQNVGENITTNESLLNMIRDSRGRMKQAHKAVVKLQNLWAKRFDKILGTLLCPAQSMLWFWSILGQF